MLILLPTVATLLCVLVAAEGAKQISGPRRGPAPTLPEVSPATPSPRLGRTHRHRLGWVCLGVVGVAAAGPIPAAILTVVGFAAVRTRALLAARSATSAQIAALPDAIDAFVFLVHAGLTPQLAIERLVNAAPPITQPAFAEVVHRTQRGEAFADALAALNTHFGASALAFVDLVAASSRYGLPMADVLTQLSVETRATRRRLDEAAARALPVKLSFPLVVCTLPSFVLLAIAPAVLAALSSLGNNAW
ncbi:MAG: pilus assembly protein TadC [Minisyncoccia bacterium]|jgi:pilus assembly protein TadC